jgi:hypothetical protein
VGLTGWHFAEAAHAARGSKCIERRYIDVRARALNRRLAVVGSLFHTGWKGKFSPVLYAAGIVFTLWWARVAQAL